MANKDSAKGNPASKRMSNPNNKAKRVRNTNKNEQLRAKGLHPKQLRQKENERRHSLNAMMIYAYGFKNRKQVHAFAKENPVQFQEAAVGVEFKPSLIKSV